MHIEPERSFVSQYPPSNFMTKKEIEDMWTPIPINLYVHIPYCVKKCGFCYYKSFPIANSQVPDEYIDALCQEIDLYANHPSVMGRPIRSVYFGGGTPTVLTVSQLTRLMTAIFSRFKKTEQFEFCCEARPGEITTSEKLIALKEHGLTRLSIGCQSLDDEVLLLNKRNHDAKEFYRTYERVRKVGIENVNVDLMSGMVGQSKDSFLRTVNEMIALQPENIAIYKMELFLNNELYIDYRKGLISLISNEEEYEIAKEAYTALLSSKYQMAEHYSFMLDPKYRHLQRFHIWSKGEEFIGFGISAHSYFNGFMYQNHLELDQYYQKIKNHTFPVYRAHQMKVQEIMIRRLIFGLKSMYFSRLEFERDFGFDVIDIFGNKLKELACNGYLTISEDSIIPTIEGAILADDIIREFYLPKNSKMMLGHVRRD